MNVMLISNTCTKGEFERLQSIKFSEKVSPQQNYFSMLIDGLLASPRVTRVVCVSARPIAQSNTNVPCLEASAERVSDRLSFFYTKVVAKNGARNITNLREVRRAVRAAMRELAQDDTVAICDPLAFDVTIGAIRALKRIPKIAVITDIPSFVGAIGKSERRVSRLKNAVKQRIFMGTIRQMQGFCFLTQAMERFNVRRVPSCIVEGMVPICAESTPKMNADRRIVLYAGGLYEKFGILNLVNAAASITDIPFELHLYGEGNCIDEIRHVQTRCPNIRYMGVVGIDQVRAAERGAALLVNPRPCDEEFTKYSFPSKTLEYMSAGRPVLTTRLPGIPEEYFNYVYSIADNGVDTIRDALSHLLRLPDEELTRKGEEARRYAEKNKNAGAQAEKIIRLAEELL